VGPKISLCCAVFDANIFFTFWPVSKNLESGDPLITHVNIDTDIEIQIDTL